MIPTPAINAWALTRPWPTRNQVEQDLILARLIVETYNHPLLRDELVFRGGTCLHQVHLSQALRYSEDLDFVRTSHSGVGPLIDAFREIADIAGLQVKGTAIGRHPKVRLRSSAESDGKPLTIKIEMNTYETTPAMPLARRPFTVSSPWWYGSADVLTFQTPELVATKLRALFQRSKGRDLFDLWLVLTQLSIPPADIVAAFAPYRPKGYTSARAIENLNAKRSDERFRTDLDLLVAPWLLGYDTDTAADLVTEQLLSIIG